MLYPQNGDCIMAIDTVTSRHPYVLVLVSRVLVLVLALLILVLASVMKELALTTTLTSGRQCMDRGKSRSKGISALSFITETT